MNTLKQSLMKNEYNALSMPIETLRHLEEDDHIVVCNGVDEYLEFMEENFVNEDMGYEDIWFVDDNFNLNDPFWYSAFKRYIRLHKTDVLKAGDNVYWVVY